MPLLTLQEFAPNLRRGDSDCSIDIVAVHGVNETLLDAWTDHDSGILWLRDLLHKSIAVARVLTFGYNASAASFYGSGSVDRIQQQAQTFVADLQADRSLEGCSQRPIIFICHGLGGILVKKALAYSATRTSKHVEHLHSIFVSTFAIMFFGTPHNGSDKANWLVSLHYEGGLKEFHENQLLSVVEKDSETLQTITDQFAPLMKQFHIFFFWEELQSTSGEWSGFMVEESSAAPMIDDTERAGIHANHSQMVKFSDTNSSSYRTIVAALIRYCKEAPSVILNRNRQSKMVLAQARSQQASELTGTIFDVHQDNKPVNYTLSLSGSTRNKHFYLPEAVSSIYTGREEVSRQVEDSLFKVQSPRSLYQQRRFIISGIGGSGKTQFCCKFAQDHRDRFWGVFWIDATSAETANHSFAKLGKLGNLEATSSAGKHWLSNLDEPWLLIINNADDPSLQIPSLFPEGDRGYILVTTRNPDFQVHATSGFLEFKGLEKREALFLLLKAAGISGPWDSSTEETGNTITDTLGYLALALIQAGALILQRICDMKDYLTFYNQYRKQAIKNRSSGTKSLSQYSIYSTWDLSLDSLEKRHTEASQDAAQLLNIVAFYHFEHIPLAIFTKALDNRSKFLESSQPSSLSARMLNLILSRLQPSLVLPNFLRQSLSKLDTYRVRKALHELRSFSLISYDGRDSSFSLHPVIHAWARDRLGKGGQALWAHVALNTIAESILLPPNDSGEAHEKFRRDILPHLDACLAACPIQITDYQSNFGGLRLPFAVAFRYTSLMSFRQEVTIAAKCGYVYLERGRFQNAAVLLLMVKDALVQSRTYENDLTMKAALALAATYWGLGRLEEAIAIQRLVVKAREKIYGPENQETLTAMNQLGSSYWLNGQYHEAIELQEVTRRLMEKALGPTHIDTLAAQDNLGVTLGSWQRYHESAAIHRKVLNARIEKLGATHIDTLATMNNLAMALLDLRDHEKARSMMFEVYEERKSKLGKEHPYTLWALCNLAKVHVEMGLLQDAEEMIVPGIEAAKRSLGDDHLGVLMGCGVLSRVLARQGRFEEAEKLMLDTIPRLEQSRGIEHPDTVYALWKMSVLYEKDGKIDKAIETCELAFERAKMRLTAAHPISQKIETQLGRLKGLPPSEDERFDDFASLSARRLPNVTW